MGKPTCSAAARERELYRYYQPEETPALNHGDTRERKSSADPVLTAFAQLGALRLKSRRGMISLGTSTEEFVIAEAGPSLSLQRDNDEADVLWHGIGTIRCKGDRESLTQHFFKSNNDKLVVNDLLKDEYFKNWDIVQEPPHVRFMAAVPLRTPSNIIIGAYMVCDVEPHAEGLSEEELQFLLDVSVTVVDYLQGGLVKRKQHRAETMIKAMGLFIEGKSSLRDWWLAYGHKGSQGHRKRTSKSVSLDELANEEFGVQDTIDNFSTAIFRPQRPTLSRATSSNAPSTGETDDHGERRPSISRGQSHGSTTDASTPFTRSMSSVFPHERPPSVTTADTHSVTFDLPEPPHSVEAPTDPDTDLQEAVVSTDLRGVFARASNLIREACGVDGVVYYDASVGSFGGSANESVMNERAPGVFAMDKTSSDDEGIIKSPVAHINGKDSSIRGHNSGSETEGNLEKRCNILGFSTRHRSSLSGHPTIEQHRHFPESALRRMMKKYPHGKLFNFDENGHLSSDSDYVSSSVDDTNVNGKDTLPDPSKKTKRRSRILETEALLRVFPGARSIFFFPLWDSSRDRWYSGSFIWSTSPCRVLCPMEDLVYLASFSNSVMAEVARISQQVLAQMKTDFIASISHELRSPLHGVLASVEFLQETEMDELQVDMVNNINASGKVLLDTINHLLDFSKVNRRTKNQSRFLKRPKRSKKQKAGDSGTSTEKDELSDICAISEEVIETVYTGHRAKKHAFGSHSDKDSTSSSEEPVSIIVDIACRPNWSFDLDAGAWRRILMNLFSNALKYTQKGYIKISLDVEEDSAAKGRVWGRNLVLKVTDSGQGISEEFIKYQLYKPFRQENSLSSGTGLGLSIIRHIVQDLGGRINIASEPNVGTEAVVKIPLPIHAEAKSSVKTGSAAEIKKHTNGMKYALEGFECYPDISEEPTGFLPADVQAANYLRETTSTVLHNWFDMEAHDPSTSTGSSAAPDMVVVMEAGLTKQNLQDVLRSHCRPLSVDEKRPIAIVLCSSFHPTVKVEQHEYFDVFHLQQPYGPNKLANLLKRIASRKVEQRPKSSDRATSLPELHIQRPPNVRGASLQNMVTPTVTSSPFSNISNESLPNGVKPSIGLWTKDVSVPSTGLWTPKSTENRSPPTVNAAPTPLQLIPALAYPSEGLRVLLVEDNEINMKLLVAYMKKLKLQHSTAGNGLEAFNAYKCEDGRHDVIFMDISMPVMDGLESSRNIRRFERENSLPPTSLIALTGAANPAARQEAFSSGVDLFLTKPVAMKSLKVMLEDIRKEGRSVLKNDGYGDQE